MFFLRICFETKHFLHFKLSVHPASMGAPSQAMVKFLRQKMIQNHFEGFESLKNLTPIRSAF